MIDLSQVQRETARWMVLQILHAGYPIGANVRVIGRILSDERLKLSREQLIAELEYLAELKLVSIERDRFDDDEIMAAKLTAAGVDVIEYTAECPAGIARPAKREA